ncbi:hypothetical protein GCM10009582_01870 [Arthrobacter flavus]
MIRSESVNDTSTGPTLADTKTVSTTPNPKKTRSAADFKKLRRRTAAKGLSGTMGDAAVVGGTLM